MSAVRLPAAGAERRVRRTCPGRRSRPRRRPGRCSSTSAGGSTGCCRATTSASCRARAASRPRPAPTRRATTSAGSTGPSPPAPRRVHVRDAVAERELETTLLVDLTGVDELRHRALREARGRRRRRGGLRPPRQRPRRPARRRAARRPGAPGAGPRRPRRRARPAAPAAARAPRVEGAGPSLAEGLAARRVPAAPPRPAGRRVSDLLEPGPPAAEPGWARPAAPARHAARGRRRRGGRPARARAARRRHAAPRRPRDRAADRGRTPARPCASATPPPPPPAAPGTPPPSAAPAPATSSSAPTATGCPTSPASSPPAAGSGPPGGPADGRASRPSPRPRGCCCCCSSRRCSAPYVWPQRRRPGYAVRFSELDLLAQRRPPRLRVAPARAGRACCCCRWSALTVGFARPRGRPQVPRERATVVVALDVSLSMQADGRRRPTGSRRPRPPRGTFVGGLPAALQRRARRLQRQRVRRRAARRSTTPRRAGRRRAAARPRHRHRRGRRRLARGARDRARRRPACPPPPARVVLLSDGANTQGRPVARRRRRSPSAPACRSRPSPTARRDGVVEVEGQRIRRARRRPRARRPRRRAPAGRPTRRRAATSSAEVYDDIGSSVGTTTEQQEVTDVLTGLGLLLGLGAAATALLWSPRLP